MNQTVSRLYDPVVRPARSRFETGIAATLLDPTLDATSLELFLIHYCARAVQMTEPVEHWIYRAGSRCEELGLQHLGRALKKHSRHEAGHHLLLLADVDRLVGRWNNRHPFQLNVKELLNIGPTPGIDAYVRLHENVIASETPFFQIAIEYEIEGLSVSLGPGLLKQCQRLLGSETVASLSFLTEHVEIDVGHTKFNEAELGRLLDAMPNCSTGLAAAGSGALDAYGCFLTECLIGSRQLKLRAERSDPSDRTASARIQTLDRSS
jgi:hypothetical protein